MLIVIDDLMHRVVEDKEMELLFTQGTHHKCVSVILITQNLYPRGKHARTIALNTWYLVLMKNLRVGDRSLLLIQCQETRSLPTRNEVCQALTGKRHLDPIRYLTGNPQYRFLQIRVRSINERPLTLVYRRTTRSTRGYWMSKQWRRKRRTRPKDVKGPC